MLFFGRKAEKIFVVSRSIVEEYVFDRALRDKILILGNTVNLRSLREWSQPCGTAYDVGFMGRLTEQKQPLVFIDIVARLRVLYPALRVLLIGEGDLRPAVEKAIAERNLAQCVTLAGFLPNPFPAVAGCKIMVMPSAWEGFGLAAVESMALGKPVLAAPVGGLKDIVHDRCGKLCMTVAEFVEEARLLLADPEYYAAKSRSAAACADQYADSEKYYDRIEAVYTALRVAA
jgi:glycosyltransferase involved in cell wall biosynthesis